MTAIHFALAHWPLLFAAALIVILLAFYFRRVRAHWPRDTVQNGIAIGLAKAFDNRSLALRIERLNAGLEALKVVDQNVTETLGNIQEQTSRETTRALSVEIKARSGKEENGDKSQEKGTEKESSQAASSPTSSSEKAEPKPGVGLAAGDVLSNQINLASQIFNLQTLYERSLTDRMINGQTRLQTVLGFQVSITPPDGYQDCVAVVEIAVRMKAGQNDFAPVSLVALMPQEKTYNAESISGSAQSIEGSAVAKVLKVGFSGKDESRDLFIHRDSDTIAFERDVRAAPPLLDNNATVFGWEFRPVLGRRAVSPGTRQMLAVIALPAADEPEKKKDVTSKPAEQAPLVNDATGKQAQQTTRPAVPAEPCIVQLKTRSYWRRYNRKRQTTGPNWRWYSWRVDHSAVVESAVQELPIPTTAKVQFALAPEIKDVEWVNSGEGSTTVIVSGRNFFSGTKVFIAGRVLTEEDGTLTLKSDQALEFQTSIESLTSGDAVLSGRFGGSIQLLIPEEKRRYTSLQIVSAVVLSTKYSRSSRVRIHVKGVDKEGNDLDLTVPDISNLPVPILLVGNAAVPLPYDYDDFDPSATSSGTSTGSGTTSGPSAVLGPEPGDPSPSKKKYISVAAWVPEKMVADDAAISFRVPFCGLDYQSSLPLRFAQPRVVRMGGDANFTVFRILYPFGFGTKTVQVELDQTYTAAGVVQLLPLMPIAGLIMVSSAECRLTVATQTVSRYQHMVVRVGTDERYLLAVPADNKPAAKPAFDAATKPPEISRDSRGPMEWSGSNFDLIDKIAFGGTPQEFTIYGNGTRLTVYLSAGSTSSEGKKLLQCRTVSGENLELPFFVVAAESS